MLANGWAWATPYLDNKHWEALEKYNRLKPVPVTLSDQLSQETEKLQAELDAIRGAANG